MKWRVCGANTDISTAKLYRNTALLRDLVDGHLDVPFRSVPLDDHPFGPENLSIFDALGAIETQDCCHAGHRYEETAPDYHRHEASKQPKPKEIAAVKSDARNPRSEAAAENTDSHSLECAPDPLWSRSCRLLVERVT